MIECFYLFNKLSPCLTDTKDQCGLDVALEVSIKLKLNLERQYNLSSTRFALQENSLAAIASMDDLIDAAIEQCCDKSV